MRILSGIPFDIASLPEDRPAGELFVLINQQNPEQPVIRLGFPPESGLLDDIIFRYQADGTWTDHLDDPSLLRLTDGFLRVTLKDVEDLINSLPTDNSAVLARLKDLVDLCNTVIKDGRLSVSDAHGLGVRLPKDLAKKYPYRPGTGEFNSVKGKVLRT